jgi:magnesium-transporting ATPase (P-type)
MNLFRKMIFTALALAASAPSQLLACPACGSANANLPASPLTNGMNLGILTLFVIIASVLGSIATFFVFIIRKEAALAAKTAAEQNFSEAKA